MTKLQSPRVILLLSLFFITILSRIPFTSKVLYHWDSVQYALAMEHYDITVHQPHPPGYFLYVMLGKFLNLFTHDANTSLVALSVFFSGLTVVMVYILANRIFNERTAIVASLLTMTSPTVWFHGEVALNYIIEAFFSTCFAYFCFRAISEEKRWILVASLVLGIAGGIRQTTLMFLLPLWIFSLIRVSTKYRIYSLGILLLCVLSWLVPMISLTGGYTLYRGALQEHLSYAVKPAMYRRTVTSFMMIKRVFQLTLVGLGFSTTFLLFYLRSRNGRSLLGVLSSAECFFFMLWVLPPSLFFLFVGIGPIGHSLIYLPAFLILSAHALDRIMVEEVNARFPRWIFALSLIATIIFNGSIFLFSDTAVSYSFLKQQREYITALVREVRAKFSPDNTVMLGRQHVFFGPRHFMYYLPEYRVYVIDERVDINNVTRQVFWGWHRTTYLSDVIHIPAAIRYFVSSLAISLEADKDFLRLHRESVIEVNPGMGSFSLFVCDINIAPVMYPKVNFVFHEHERWQSDFDSIYKNFVVTGSLEKTKPVTAVECLKKEKLKGNMFNEYEESILEKYNVRWIIFNSDAMLTKILLEKNDWKLIYADKVANILVKNVPENQDLINKYGEVKPIILKEGEESN